MAFKGVFSEFSDGQTVLFTRQHRIYWPFPNLKQSFPRAYLSKLLHLFLAKSKRHAGGYCKWIAGRRVYSRADAACLARL